MATEWAQVIAQALLSGVISAGAALGSVALANQNARKIFGLQGYSLSISAQIESIYDQGTTQHLPKKISDIEFSKVILAETGEVTELPEDSTLLGLKPMPVPALRLLIVHVSNYGRGTTKLKDFGFSSRDGDSQFADPIKAVDSKGRRIDLEKYDLLPGDKIAIYFMLDELLMSEYARLLNKASKSKRITKIMHLGKVKSRFKVYARGNEGRLESLIKTTLSVHSFNRFSPLPKVSIRYRAWDKYHYAVEAYSALAKERPELNATDLLKVYGYSMSILNHLTEKKTFDLEELKARPEIEPLFRTGSLAQRAAVGTLLNVVRNNLGNFVYRPSLWWVFYKQNPSLAKRASDFLRFKFNSRRR